MSAYMLRITAFSGACIFFFNGVKAQIAHTPKWEVGVYGGAYIYQGDLTPQRIGSLKTIKPGFGVQVTRILTPAFSAMLSLTSARLKGDESKYKTPDWRQQRNFAFNSPVKEINLTILYSIFKSNWDYRKIEPFVFAGGSLAFVNPARDYSRLNTTVFGELSDVQVGLNQDLAKKPPRIIPNIPVGVGLKYNIGERLAVNTLTTYRLMFTDYLDGFSKAASPKYYDHYASQTVGLVYKFGKKKGDYLKCPGAN